MSTLKGQMKRIFTFAVLLTVLTGLMVLAACGPVPGVSNHDDSGALRSIRMQSGQTELSGLLSGHVGYLAADALGGRDVGTPGIEEAERYIAEMFASLGLAPLPGRDDYFLEFTLYRGGYDPAATNLQIKIDGTEVRARPGVDFRPFDFSAVGEFQGQLVFAGYGITAPEYGYDDYEGLETEGKIVLLLRHEPHSPAGSEYFQGADLTKHALFLTKAENARAHGAAGMLLVTDPASSTEAEDLRLLGPLALEPGDLNRVHSDRKPIPAVQISQPFAQKLLSASGLDLEQLQESLDRGKSPSALQIVGMSVSLSVTAERLPQQVQARNVAAFLQGSDPLLREQWILIGAHHDHLGAFSGEGDTVFNGADDNASGTAGVLALAAVLSELDPAPARSIVFVTFSAEERGLLGSRAMTSGQIRPEKVVLMINLDMIGRNPEKPVQAITSGSSPEVKRLVEAANSELQLPLRFSGIPEAAVSDYAPFHRLGIPILFFFTGIHDDYHGIDDEADRISYARLAEVVELAAGTVVRAAEAKQPPGSTVYLDRPGTTVDTAGKRDRQPRTTMKVRYSP